MPGNLSLYLGFAIMGFFLGSVMFALILPRHFKGIDIRDLSDDGNPGTANAVKYGGVALGLLCLLGDLLKAGLPVYLARRFCGMESLLFALVMVAPVLGHAFSPFLGGHGGKAIAPGLWRACRSASGRSFCRCAGHCFYFLLSGDRHYAQSSAGRLLPLLF